MNPENTNDFWDNIGYSNDAIIDALRILLTGYDITKFVAITEEPNTPSTEPAENRVEADGVDSRTGAVEEKESTVRTRIRHAWTGIIRTSSFPDSSVIFPERTEDVTGCKAKLVTREQLSPFQVTLIAHDRKNGNVIFIFYELNKTLFVPYLHETFNEDDPVQCKCVEIPETVSKREIIDIYLPKLFQSKGVINSRERASEWQLGDGRHRTAYSNTDISKETPNGRRVYWRAKGSDIVVTSNPGFALEADIVQLGGRFRSNRSILGFMKVFLLSMLAFPWCLAWTLRLYQPIK